jgi:phospholipid/cholesterol/gamma-HCH transport system permease protein
MTASATNTASRVALDRAADGTLRARLSGRWALAEGVPRVDELAAGLQPGTTRLVLEDAGLESWDSALVAFVHDAAATASRLGVEVDAGRLPEGARRLLGLALAVKPHVEPVVLEDDALTARVGRVGLHVWGTAGDALTFLGETVLALGLLVRGRARFRRVDLLHALEATGVSALGIVALINFLIGAVLAFVGAVQLQQFGAAIYVANLVGIGVLRELGPLMTGFVMAGRTGAAFAATLGTMTVNEEVDALRTMGLRPAEFLVLPRVVATSLMMPALVAYADLLGLLGGLFVGVAMLGIGTTEYVQQTQASVELRHAWIGLAKGVAFGAVVALTGTYYGIRCGRSAAAVGEAATKAVVMGILLVVVVDAVVTVLTYVLGI